MQFIITILQIQTIRDLNILLKVKKYPSASTETHVCTHTNTTYSNSGNNCDFSPYFDQQLAIFGRQTFG